MLCFAFHIEGKQDIEEIKYHAFFVDVNWDVMVSLADSKLKFAQTNYFVDSRNTATTGNFTPVSDFIFSEL